MWYDIQRVMQYSARSLPWIKRLVPHNIYNKAQEVLIEKVTQEKIDRKYLVNFILPELAELTPLRVLFVGCQRYTRGYQKVFPVSEFWTLDIEPGNTKWGSELHKTGDVSELDVMFEASYFDIIIINGVFGWGVDSKEAIGKTLQAVSHTLRAQGVLMIGWNRDRCPDPSSFVEMGANFDYVGFGSFPRRITFPDSTHVYDFFARHLTVHPRSSHVLMNFSEGQWNRGSIQKSRRYGLLTSLFRLSCFPALVRDFWRALSQGRVPTAEPPPGWSKPPGLKRPKLRGLSPEQRQAMLTEYSRACRNHAAAIAAYNRRRARLFETTGDKRRHTGQR